MVPDVRSASTQALRNQRGVTRMQSYDGAVNDEVVDSPTVHCFMCDHEVYASEAYFIASLETEYDEDGYPITLDALCVECVIETDRIAKGEER